MTDLRKTAQQALEALDDERYVTKYTHIVEAITALRKALAQPEQEPTCPECKAVVLYECVACSNNNYPPKPEQEPCIGKDPRCPCQDGDACHYKDCGGTKARPVAQPEQEPVAWMVKLGDVTCFQHHADSKHASVPLYTAPPAAQPPAEWELIKNILAEYGLDAIAFVAEWKAAQPAQEPVAYYHPHKGFYWAKPTHISAPTVVDVPPVPLYVKWKAAQRKWVGLTDEDWDKVGDMPDTWDQGAAWAAARLKEKNDH